MRRCQNENLSFQNATMFNDQKDICDEIHNIPYLDGKVCVFKGMVHIGIIFIMVASHSCYFAHCASGELLGAFKGQ